MHQNETSSGATNFTRDLLVAIDQTGCIVYANEQFGDRFIGPGRDPKGRFFGSLLHADDLRSLESAQEQLALGLACRFLEVRCQTVGGWRWFRWELKASRNDAGDVLFVELAGRDSTREKFREEQLFKLSHAVEQSPVAIAMTDKEGYVQYANPKYMDAVGYTLEEILDRRARILDTARLTDEERDMLWKTLDDGGTWSRELIDRRSDGNDYWVSVRITPIYEGAESAQQLLVILDDITERKELERQIREAQKMENLGTLAGGIAHDFNNLLCVMSGYCAFAEKEAGNQEPLRSHLTQISTAVERAVSLVQQILTFARSSDSHFRPLQLNRVVQDLLEITSETFPRTIEFHLQMDNSLPWIEGDINQLHQAFLNVAVNARDALDGKGKVILRTFQVREHALPSHILKPSGSLYAAVSISDTGSGMDEDTVRRIFEPFFTTKDIGKGTGLGLAVTYGIMQSHGGYVDVRSIKGKGSTFTFYFPACKKEGIAFEPEVPAQSLGGTGETILLVEDEDSQLRLQRQLLNDHGYKVIVARDGLNGLEMFGKHHEQIDLVISDVGLPGIGGWEMFGKMRLSNPALPALFLSGYLPKEVSIAMAQTSGVDFLQKPYNTSTVLVKASELLKANSSRPEG